MKEFKIMLEEIGLDNLQIRYVTHSTSFLFNLFGEMKLKRLERSLQNIPLIKNVGGSITLCGSKLSGEK